MVEHTALTYSETLQQTGIIDTIQRVFFNRS